MIKWCSWVSILANSCACLLDISQAHCPEIDTSKWPFGFALMTEQVWDTFMLWKVSSMVLSFIPDDVSITAWEIWELLANLYKRSNISLQFAIRTQITSLKITGAADAEKYITVHTAANEHLASMGARFSDANAIYALLEALLSNWCRGHSESGRNPVSEKLLT